MGTKDVLPDFQEFLLSHKLAPEKHVLFLAIWVSVSRKAAKGAKKNIISTISHL